MATKINSTSSFEAQIELEALNADFCHHLDHGNVAELVDLFTEDAFYAHGDRVTCGRSEIFELFSARAGKSRTSRHFQTSLRLQVLSETQAAGHSTCMTFAADGNPPIYTATPTLVADFIDEYRRCSDGRWRIERRQIERIFVDRGNKGPVDARPKDG
jgi:ketosteroid isomerase-like protein